MKVPLRHSHRTAVVRIASVLGFFTFYPVHALAQVPSPSTSATNAVKQPSLAEGDRFFFAADLTTALRIYRAVQAQRDSRDCQHRIAVTEDRLGHYGVAYVEYVRFLERFGAELAPNLKRAVEVRLRELEKFSSTANLNVRDKPAILTVDPVAADAVLWIDGKPVGVGPRPVELPSGKHTLELRRPGYRTQKLVLDAKPGQKSNLRAGPYVIDATAVKPATPPPRALPPEPQRSPPSDERDARSVTAQATAEPDEERQFQGIYGALIVPVMLGGDSTHSYVNHCPADTYSGACTTTAPRGGGLGLRLGYFYEWVGLELFAAGAIDVSTSELKLPPIPTISEQMQDLAGKNVFIRAGGLFGGGIRFATPLQGIRVTVGADYVYVYRKVFAIPDSFAGASLGYSVPGYFFDGGLQLGSTPGARFYLGAFLFIETAHELVLNRDLAALGIDPTAIPTELTSMSVYRGPQYFFGPLLGIAFGR